MSNYKLIAFSLSKNVVSRMEFRLGRKSYTENRRLGKGSIGYRVPKDPGSREEKMDPVVWEREELMRRRDVRASPHLSPGLLGGTLDSGQPPPESKDLANPARRGTGNRPEPPGQAWGRAECAGAVSTTSTYRLTFLTAQGVLCPGWRDI